MTDVQKMAYNARMARKKTDRRYDLAALCLEIREEEGATQSEMAKLLGITEDAYANWERGRAYPSAEYLIDLLKIRAKRRQVSLKALLPF